MMATNPNELELLEDMLANRGPSDNEMILLALVGVLAGRLGGTVEPIVVSIDEMDAPQTRRVEINHAEGEAPWVISFRAAKGNDNAKA
jgi:hypothetical protein